jgi:CubicO group peptidase (beta-lactamase class C family)
MFLPELKYPAYGWSDYLNGGSNDSSGARPRITLRQLASHMSGKYESSNHTHQSNSHSTGIGRDYPLDIGEWPQISAIRHTRTQENLPLPERGRRGFAELVKSVNTYPLINLPYDYPIYSNTGIDLLGLSNAAANKRHAGSNSENEPQTHEDLVQRDIFDPLGLNASFYRVPYGTPLVDDLAIPNQDHEWAVSVSFFLCGLWLSKCI